MTNGGKQEGYTLVETCFGLLVIGFLIVAGIYLYQLQSVYKRIHITEENTKAVQTALVNYIHTYGHLPCPASNTASLDSPEFGMEVADICTGAHDGVTYDPVSRVMIGSVPVRSLNISDTMIMDGWRQRFIYAVSEDFALSGADMEGTEGTITVTDVNGNSLSSAAGKAIFALLSPGQDPRGAYGLDGNLLKPCDPGAVSGENCDGDGKFVDSVYKNFSDSSLLTSSMSFGANLTRYEWAVEGYGPCTGVCGSGTQTRVVKCVNHKNDKVDDSLCKKPKPAITRTCDSGECKWKAGEFGNCTCNAVSVSRPVFCVGSSGQKVDDKFCKDVRPESSMSCIDSVSVCRYIWKAKPWAHAPPNAAAPKRGTCIARVKITTFLLRILSVRIPSRPQAPRAARRRRYASLKFRAPMARIAETPRPPTPASSM
ncbi:MAG TPA: thrombospondin type-1 domain-containing protein [Micavibrio sp.]|nr:thrombospondin type-1 domain-containing protein [Micavibrio sp.]